MITQERLDKTIKQITQQSPEYVFIEGRLLGQWPPAFVQYFPGIAIVLRYIIETLSASGTGAVFDSHA